MQIAVHISSSKIISIGGFLEKRTGFYRFYIVLLIVFGSFSNQMYSQDLYSTKQLGLVSVKDSCWCYSVLDAASRFSVTIDKIRCIKPLSLYIIKGELTMMLDKDFHPAEVYIYKGINNKEERVIKDIKFIKEINTTAKAQFKVITRIKKGYGLFFYKDSYSVLEFIPHLCTSK